MSRVLMAWELGGGAGHLHNLHLIGADLRKRGHDVCFVVRDLARAGQYFDYTDTMLLQAPIWTRQSRLPTSRNYAELLNRVGYLHTEHIAGLLAGWRELLRLVKPDLMVAEHSPTALLAARLEGVRRATLGTGFETPPRISPMPGIQPWRETPEERLVGNEAVVLRRINEALAAQGGEPLDTLGDIFDLDASFMCTLAEFDHYSERGEADYFGPIDLPQEQEDPAWPAGEGDRIFVYYRVGYPHFGPMMEQLASLGLPTLVVADDAAPAVIKKFSTDHLKIITTPVSLEAVAKTAKLTVCHAGHGSVLRLVLGGCPLVMMPVVIEQALMAHRMFQAGVGLVVPVERGKRPDVAGPVRRVLAEPEFADRAREMASNHTGFDPVAQIGRIGDRCEAILSGA